MSEYEAHILVVDDEPHNLEIICEYLDEFDYRLSTAENGTQAWEMLSADPGNYDVIILDRMMPEMGGMEVLQKIQDDAILKVDVDEWLDRLEALKADNPELWSSETTYEFLLVDVAGYAASAKLDVFRGETHFSTDYMLLYKFTDGWKIVSKIFSGPR